MVSAPITTPTGKGTHNLGSDDLLGDTKSYLLRDGFYYNRDGERVVMGGYYSHWHLTDGEHWVYWTPA